MKILFDHNVNRRFVKYLSGHEIQTARQMGWEKLANGILLATAAKAGFEAFLSLDKKLEHEQNLSSLPLAVIVIDSTSNALEYLLPFAGAILQLLASPLDRALYLVQPKAILRLTAPRGSAG